MISPFYQGEVFNDDLARLDLCWYLLMNFGALKPYYILVDLYVFVYHNYPYVQAGVFLTSHIFITIGLSIFRGSHLTLKPYY